MGLSTVLLLLSGEGWVLMGAVSAAVLLADLFRSLLAISIEVGTNGADAPATEIASPASGDTVPATIPPAIIIPTPTTVLFTNARSRFILITFYAIIFLRSSVVIVFFCADKRTKNSQQYKLHALKSHSLVG